MHFLSGDFEQCLPVVPREGRTGVTAVSLNQSPLWDYMIKTTLSRSIRLAPGLQHWQDYVEKVGTGEINKQLGQVEIRLVNITREEDDKINFIFPDLCQTDSNSVILSTSNITINNKTVGS